MQPSEAVLPASRSNTPATVPVAFAASRLATRALGFRSLLVYTIHMTRTNIDIDDEACTEVMRRYRLSTKREAVNFALRTVAAEPLGLDEARRLRGSGWDGDLDEMRSGRAR